MSLSKLSINYIKSLVNMNNPTKVLLGRWNIKENTTQIDTKVFWANSDHCGDIICGNPLKNKKNFENHKTQ